MFDAWVDLLKSILGIPEDDTSQDEIIKALAELSLSHITQLTGRKFVQGVYRDSFIVPDRIIYLTEFPVFEVQSIGYPGGGDIPATAYSLDKASGRLVFLNQECRCHPRACVSPGLVVEYAANAALPPSWVTFATADAIRAALAQMQTGNQYGFNAKKVAVTDVGSVEFSSLGDNPTATLTATLDASVGPWVPPEFGASRSCCGGPQVSEFVAEWSPPP